MVQSLRADLVAAGLDMAPEASRKRRAKNSDGSRDAERPAGAMIKHRSYRGGLQPSSMGSPTDLPARDELQPTELRKGPRLSQAERSAVVNAQKMNAGLTKGGSVAGGLGLASRFDLPPVAPRGTWPVTGSPR